MFVINSGMKDNYSRVPLNQGCGYRKKDSMEIQQYFMLVLTARSDYPRLWGNCKVTSKNVFIYFTYLENSYSW